MSLITLTNGHQMDIAYYNMLITHFKTVLEQFGAKVIQCCRPAFKYDYSFLIHTQKDSVPKEAITLFGNAGLKTEIQQLQDTTSMLRLKY